MGEKAGRRSSGLLEQSVFTRGMMVNPSACLGCTWVMGVVLSHALKARFRTLELILWTVRRCWVRK